MQDQKTEAKINFKSAVNHANFSKSMSHSEPEEKESKQKRSEWKGVRPLKQEEEAIIMNLLVVGDDEDGSLGFLALREPFKTEGLKWASGEPVIIRKS